LRRRSSKSRKDCRSAPNSTKSQLREEEEPRPQSGPQRHRQSTEMLHALILHRRPATQKAQARLRRAENHSRQIPKVDLPAADASWEAEQSQTARAQTASGDYLK